jgi:hypothetical protein
MSFEYAPTLNADLRFFALHGYAANLGHVAEFHTAAWEIFLPIARREHRTQCRNCTQRGLVGPVCVDRTNENAIALLERFFRARQEIQVLEAWATAALLNAIVDHYRRQRGERGALQRARVPKWLATAFGHDPKRVLLAELIIDWVGVPTTGGLSSLWPYGEWADRCAPLAGGRHAYGERDVRRDVEHVLAVMRRQRPAWFAAHILEPLTYQEVPVVHEPGGTEYEQFRRAREASSAKDEQYLDDSATNLIAALQAEARRGGGLSAAVVRHLIAAEFGRRPAGSDVGRLPGDEPADLDDAVHSALTDDRIDALVAEVLAILAETGEDDSEH